MRLLIAGDFCPNYRVAELFEQEKFSIVLGEVKDYFEKADYSIVNFESTISYDEGKKINKCGPNLRCSEKGIRALKWMGAECITLANNHSMDYGEYGLYNTLKCCQDYDIDYVGVGDNLEKASSVLYKNIQGKRIAIINCCEHEFSIATKEKPGANPLNPIQQFYSIKEAKEKSDYVVVIVHGGHEHYQYPSSRMQDSYRFFIDAGANVVINHHQHCYSGYEKYKGGLIFYGLGNFCFDWKGKRPDTWYQGYMIELTIESRNVDFRVIPYIQCEKEPIVMIQKPSSFNATIDLINRIIDDKESLCHEEKQFYLNSNLEMNLVLEPITNRVVQALQIRKFLPSYYFSRKYILRLYNFLMCESHRDKVNFYLESKL